MRDERSRVRPVGDNDMVKTFLENLAYALRLTRHGRRPFDQPSAPRGMVWWCMPNPGNKPVEANIVSVLHSIFLLIPVDHVEGGIFFGALGIRVRAIRHDVLERAAGEHM